MWTWKSSRTRCHYSPHSKLAAIRWLAYMAPTSVLLLCLGPTSIMKGILLHAHKVVAYAFTHRKPKNKINVTLETSSTYVTRSHTCMGTLWNATPVQANIAIRAPYHFGPLHCISIPKGLKKNIKSAHSVTLTFCNFSNHQLCENDRKKRIRDLGAYAKFIQNINVKRFIKESVHWLVQLCPTSTKPTATIQNLFMDKVRLG